MNAVLLRRGVGLAVALVLSAGLAAVAALPTGAPTLSGVVPSNARLAAVANVGATRVLLLSGLHGLQVEVAYRSSKGWLAIDAPTTQVAPAVGWTATPGSDPVPALSAVYGRATGQGIRVQWADGLVQTVAVDADGTWLAARHGDVTSSSISILGSDGSVVLQLKGP